MCIQKPDIAMTKKCPNSGLQDDVGQEMTVVRKGPFPISSRANVVLHLWLPTVRYQDRMDPHLMCRECKAWFSVRASARAVIPS